MWFEILPAAFIIGGAIAFPGLCIIVMNKLVYGNMYSRDLTYPLDRRYYLRDRRLTNDPYKQLGLESIRDDDDKPTDDGGENSGICKLLMETNSSAPSNRDPKYTNNDSKPPPQDLKAKDPKDESCASTKTDIPDGKDKEKSKKKKPESLIEMKKDIILGSAGQGGLASTTETNRDNSVDYESADDPTH